MPQLFFLSAWPGFYSGTMQGVFGLGSEHGRADCCSLNSFHPEHHMLSPGSQHSRDKRSLGASDSLAESGSVLGHMTTPQPSG